MQRDKWWYGPVRKVAVNVRHQKMIYTSYTPIYAWYTHRGETNMIYAGDIRGAVFDLVLFLIYAGARHPPRKAHWGSKLAFFKQGMCFWYTPDIRRSNTHIAQISLHRRFYLLSGLVSFHFLISPWYTLWYTQAFSKTRDIRPDIRRYTPIYATECFFYIRPDIRREPVSNKMMFFFSVDIRPDIRHTTHPRKNNVCFEIFKNHNQKR